MNTDFALLALLLTGSAILVGCALAIARFFALDRLLGRVQAAGSWTRITLGAIAAAAGLFAVLGGIPGPVLLQGWILGAAFVAILASFVFFAGMPLGTRSASTASPVAKIASSGQNPRQTTRRAA